MSISTAGRWLTAKQVSDEYNLNEATLYRWARDGVIPSKRIGLRTVRFNRDEVEAFLAGGDAA